MRTRPFLALSPLATMLCACSSMSATDRGGAFGGAGPDASVESDAASAATGRETDAGPSSASPVATSAGDAGTTGVAMNPSSAARDAGTAATTVAGDAGIAGAGGPEKCVNRAPVAATWKLAWADEFDVDGAPNPANWGFEHGFVRNQELQWYQPDNATVQGGLLTIAAQRQQVTNPNFSAGSSDWKTNRQFAQYTSSSMTTSGKHSFQYGRFEICARIDTRQGSWPAFWILGNGRSWPASGEVDIMEYYASGVRANVCKPSGSTCNWSGSVSQALSSLGANWSSEYHLWAMEWDSKTLNLLLDDKVVYPFTVSSAVTSGTNPYVGNPFYILLDLAIGSNGGDPTNTTFPITYNVDYVRVYQQP